MPNWKKVIVSGSDAILSNITASNISASGHISASNFIGDGSGLTNLPPATAFPFTGDAEITGSLTVSGSGNSSIFIVDGRSFFKDQVTFGNSTADSVSFTSRISSNFLSTGLNSERLGTQSEPWFGATITSITSSNISSSGDLFFSASSNSDTGFKTLVIDTSTGQVYHTGSYPAGSSTGDSEWFDGGTFITSSKDVEITGSLKVNGDITAAVTNTSRLGIILKPSTGTIGATQFAKIQDSNGNDIITRQQGTVNRPHELWIGRNTGYAGDNNIIINGPGNPGSPSFNQTDLGVTSLWVWQGANTYGQYITGRTQDNTSTALLVRNWNGSSGVPNYETYFQLRNDKFVLISGSLELTGSANISNDITASGDILIEGGGLSIKNDGAQSYARFYCESNNFHYTEVKAQPHSLFSGNPIMLLPAYDFDFAKPKFIPSITASADISSSGDIFFNPANATTGTSVLTIDPTTGKVFRTGSYSAGGGSSPAFPFTGDAEITGSLTISGSSASSILIVDGKTFFKGQVSVGNSPGDSIDFTSRVTSDFIASGNNDETLGTRSKPWYGATITSITGSNISASGDLHAGLVDNNDTGFRVVVVDTETGKFYRTGSYAGGGGGSGENYDLNATTAISSTTAANLNLTSTSGTDDSVVKIEAGPNITINRNSATEIAISGSGGGGTDVNTATKIFVWYNTIT